jgi:hypothetical protein
MRRQEISLCSEKEALALSVSGEFFVFRRRLAATLVVVLNQLIIGGQYHSAVNRRPFALSFF